MEAIGSDTQANKHKVISENVVRGAVSAIIKEIEKLPNIRFLCGIPKNGIIVAHRIKEQLPLRGFEDFLTILPISELERVPKEQVLIVDDIIDSGRTIAPFLEQGYYCAVLVTKLCADEIKTFTPIKTLFPYPILVEPDVWVEFPWEDFSALEAFGVRRQADTVQDNIARVIQYLGYDINAPDFAETPERVARLWATVKEIKENPPVIKTFPGDNFKHQVIGAGPIWFQSYCAHHLIPFFGYGFIGYIVNQETPLIMGASKMFRIVRWAAAGLQTQEEMAHKICEYIRELVNPLAVGVTLKGEHLCISGRGVNQHGAKFFTNELDGAFLDNDKSRAEYDYLANMALRDV